MDETTRARQIAGAIQVALEAPCPTGDFTVTKRVGCASCDPGACPVCGYLFTGETFTIMHMLKGKRTLSDKAVHYLSHGIVHYQTGYVIHGEPVVVDLNLDELACYLDL
jgi:hypothetical protein